MNPYRFYLSSITDQDFGLCIGPDDLIFPSYNIHGSNYYRPWKWSTQRALKDFGSTIQNEREKFKICLDVQHFQPNEISVKVSNNEIIIEGSHEEREDSHGFISRHFKRRYLLPNECAAESVVSSLSSDGILIVTANKNVDLKSTEIKVPIKLYDVISNEPNTKNSGEISLESSKDTPKNDKEKTNKCTTIMLKEDHCRLLKPELLGEVSAAISGNTNIQKKTEIDQTVRASTSEQILGTKLSKTQERAQESGTAAVEIIGTSVESGFKTLELSNMESFASKSLQVQQSTSSYSSSESSSIRETTDRISEIVSDLSAQLKEAAENI